MGDAVGADDALFSIHAERAAERDDGMEAAERGNAVRVQGADETGVEHRFSGADSDTARR